MEKIVEQIASGDPARLEAAKSFVAAGHQVLADLTRLKDDARAFLADFATLRQAISGH